jgi:hypothetical protein
VYNSFIFGSEVATMRAEEKVADIIQRLIYSMRDGERGDLEKDAETLVKAFKDSKLMIACNYKSCSICPIKKFKKV